MCITLIKLSINCSGEVQPKWTMPGRVKYIPNIVMDLDINPTVSHLDKSKTIIAYDFKPNWQS